MDTFKAYAGTLSKDLVSELRSHSDIDYIEPEQVYTLHESQTNPPSWGLSRISQRVLNLTAPYLYPDSAGEGVDVYVIDTGIYAAHQDFEGRASLPISFIDGEAAEDLNGHGTHVAGTVGGKTFGVAKKANLIGVKVLSGAGTGSTSGVIAGVNWVANQVKSSGRKSVANMSLGGGKSQALVAAVEAAVKAGVSFIVAAGNESQDACNFTPANAPSAFAVGSTTQTDSRRYTSNWGACVKLSAPGTEINSAYIGAVDASKKLSGTSMASPHVAGVAALLLSKGTVSTPQEVYDALTSAATKDVLTDLKGATPNLLLYSSQE
ncbi:subtilisin-like protein [Basidiobolus meristosporus CBS 931.73]|uniref:Subtilisin-like protein n=1 Tax=Basidiobolus meristosporus CBS 931.73 TaxID=1314790 RepID=A0A1Y1YN35_9FUNG|nr:subtilisin-like protein [Basidiobolus meristosporus CBS 931.73]|eukprot:ORX99440.1 subtilisin-like protein [Basidiobolus meristosporus CBS 931.73]